MIVLVLITLITPSYLLFVITYRSAIYPAYFSADFPAGSLETSNKVG